jgi:hypothetical protein
MKWLKFFVLLSAISFIGCGGTVDTSGDENDPATSTDVEAMGSETGDVS